MRKERVRGAHEVGMILKNAECSASPTANYQVVATISIDIEPTHSWSELAELFRQEPLARKIVESLLMVLVSEGRGHIFEPERFSFWRHPNVPGGICLRDRINNPRLDVLDRCLLSTAP